MRNSELLINDLHVHDNFRLCWLWTATGHVSDHYQMVAKAWRRVRASWQEQSFNEKTLPNHGRVLVPASEDDT